MKTKAIFLSNEPGWSAKILPRVYPPAVRAQLESLVDLHPVCLHVSDLAQPAVAAVAKETELIFSTWGMPSLTAEQLADHVPQLRAVFYAAGSVQSFARPLLARNITVVSAWAANAVSVAEFTMAQVLLATKHVFPATRRLFQAGPDQWRQPEGPGNYRTTVALISLGMIGRKVAGLLRQFDLDLIAYEPFPQAGVAEGLGVRLVPLQECFRSAEVVSLHLPNLPSTQKMIGRPHFESMRPGATLINTARGGPVDQEAMLDVLSGRPDLTAIIDVTDPHEPPPAGSRYYSLSNVFLTPHMAGATGNEVGRMGDCMVGEVARFLSGQRPLYAVSEAMLETMA